MTTKREIPQGTTPLGVAVQHQSISLRETEFHDAGVLAFDLFDPAFGTLSSILISCETRLILSGSVKNDADGPRRFGLTTSVAMRLDLPPGLPPGALDTEPAISVTFSLPVGGSSDLPWNAGIDQRAAVIHAPSDLALFSGSGRWQMEVSTHTKSMIRGGDGCIGSAVRAKAALDVMVQYEFVPASSTSRRIASFQPSFVAAGPGKAGGKSSSRKR